jgi:uncharacterized protein YdhG (YjbR/CyaY superfamily)
MVRRAADKSESGTVDEYIADCPEDVRGKLEEIRTAIREAAPGAVETTSYFGIPGYSYQGYDYNGMFVWFDFRNSQINLRLRPPVLENHKKDLVGFVTTKSVVRFPSDEKIPILLVKRLVKASVRIMKDKREKDSEVNPKNQGRAGHEE